MSLLNESKKAWLLSYVIFTIIPGTLYIFTWKNEIAKTIGIMLFEAQVIILIFFLFITIFKVKKTFFKFLALLLYLSCVIYGCAVGVLHEWYVIILTFVVSGLYMLWNLGGVINCAIANWYKNQINTLVSKATVAYNDYAALVREYNELYSEHIKIAKEPDWNDYTFYSDSMDRFVFKNAIIGECDTWEMWGKKIIMISNISSNLDNRVSTIIQNTSELEIEYKELSDITEISSQATKAKSSFKDIEKLSKKLIKKHHKVLKKALESKI